MLVVVEEQEKQLQKARNIAGQIEGLRQELAALFGGGEHMAQFEFGGGAFTEERERIVSALEAALEAVRTLAVARVGEAALGKMSYSGRRSHRDEAAKTLKNALGA